jgi:hypothetical protein
MQTISKTSLDTVTGGTGSTIAGGSSTAGATIGGSAPGTLGTGIGGTTGLGGLGGAFSALNNEISQLNKNNNGGFNDTDMMMFGMAMMMSRPEYGAAPVFVYGGGGGCGGGCGHRCW